MPFPFIYPPDMYMRPPAVQRFVSRIWSATRPILYGIRYCLCATYRQPPPQTYATAG